MSEPLRVTVFDPATGETSTSEIEPGNYMVICHEPCWLDNSNQYANGTTLLTIKGPPRQTRASWRPANVLDQVDLTGVTP